MYTEVIDKYKGIIAQENVDEHIKNEANRLDVLDLLAKISEEISEIDQLKFDIQFTSTGKAVLMFKYKDTNNEKCSGGILIGNNLVETLENLVNSIIKCERILFKLNRKIEETRINNGILLSFKLKFSMGNSASVAYWDYKNVVIKLSKASVYELISNYSDDAEIDKLTSMLNWENNVVDFLKSYNSMSLSKEIKSELDNSDIVKLISSSMLSTSNIRDIINSSERAKTKPGIQHIKSVSIIAELGLFAAILLWDIDYSKQQIYVEIMDDTALDIENSRFVSDHSLYSRIKQKILSEAESITF